MLGNSGLDAILARTYKSRLGTCFAVSAQSTNLMSSGSDQRIRHVAIVLQSLDAATSRGLLGQLPPASSKLVRQAMVHLGTVTPQERAAAFQSMEGLLSAANVRTERAPTKESLSPAASLLASQQSVLNDQIELSNEARHQDRHDQDRHDQDRHDQDWQLGVPNANHDAKSRSWQLMPAEALADILQGERPIVIATVINQVSVERATAIAQALPMPVAAATLAALPHLHLTDAAILLDIQLELERKIGQYQAPKKASAEGLSKLTAIVASMPESQQDSWTKAIAQSNPVLAAKLGWGPDTLVASSPSSTHSAGSKTSTRTAAVTIDKSYPPTLPIPMVAAFSALPQSDTAYRIDRSKQASNEDIFDDSIILPFHPPAVASTEASATEWKQSVTSQHPEAGFGKTAMDDLLQLSDRDFVAVLHASQPQTVLMALSGATKAFVARVERLMPPKDVKRLRKRLTSLGPIQLRDVDAAQTLIAQTATKMLASGLVEATASVSFLAAA